MNLLKFKDCSKCINSLVYGSDGNYTIKCISDNYDAKELFNTDGKFCAANCNYYVESDKVRSGTMSQDSALNFMLSGQSEFILHSSKTNEDFRFRLNIKKSDSYDNYIILVNSIMASEIEYCGIIIFDKDSETFLYKQGKNGKEAPSSIKIRSLIFILNKLYRNETVKNLVMYNVGKCGCCGKGLYTEQELNSGIHKKCDTLSMYDKVIVVKNE